MPRHPKKRRRLDADAARELILDAAEKRLVTVGPSGIRLQEVAADAGLSHPTLLHHFGSRELLVKAVCSRALRAINDALVQAIQASSGDESKLEAMFDSVAAALSASGHARVVWWLALEGHRLEGSDVRLDTVVDATHALRLEHANQQRRKTKRPSREDTARTVVLASLALTGGAVIGSVLLENAGLGAGPAVESGFRKWLARLLMDHLDA